MSGRIQAHLAATQSQDLTITEQQQPILIGGGALRAALDIFRLLSRIILALFQATLASAR